MQIIVAVMHHPESDCCSAGIYAVYHDRHYQQAKVRLFIDFIDKQLSRLL